MGVDYRVYVGPYLRCVNPLVDREFIIRSCTSERCEKYGKQRHDDKIKFCESCGSEIGDTAITKRVPKIDTYETMMAMDEAFFCPGQNYSTFPFEDEVDVWEPNRKLNDRMCSWDPRRDCPEIQIENKLIDGELALLQDKFAAELEVFRRFYGTENVSLHWGVLSSAW